jgi:hypothetical protein
MRCDDEASKIIILACGCSSHPLELFRDALDFDIQRRSMIHVRPEARRSCGRQGVLAVQHVDSDAPPHNRDERRYDPDAREASIFEITSEAAIDNGGDPETTSSGTSVHRVFWDSDRCGRGGWIHGLVNSRSRADATESATEPDVIGWRDLLRSSYCARSVPTFTTTF